MWWREYKLEFVCVVFGERGLMLPLDPTADLLLFYHQKYQELQNLLHMCVYSALARNAAKQDRMRPNAHNSGLPQGSSSYTMWAVVTPLMFPQVPESIPAWETCWELLNKLYCLKQLEGREACQGSTTCTCSLLPLPWAPVCVIIGHSTVGKTDLGLSSSCWKTVIRNCHCMAMYTRAVFRFFFLPSCRSIT